MSENKFLNHLNKDFTEKNQFKRIFNAIKYSINGFKSAFTTEAAFRQNCIIFIINTFLAFILPKDMIVCVWFMFCGIFVLFAELMNTAIEYIVDRIGKEINPLSGKAKDVGSSLVFLALTNLFLSWIVYFIKQ